VLDALVAADPRYEWREDDGVIVVRPVGAWSDDTSALPAPLAGVTLDDITVGEVLHALARLVGAEPFSRAVDSRRFSVHVRDGASWLETLNAIVRAHGTLTWIIEPSQPYNANWPLYIMLSIGGAGAGFGVPADAVLAPSLAIPRPAADAGSDGPLLDRLVGTGRYGDPIRAHTVNGQLAVTLANAVGVPIGFESLPATQRLSWFSDGISLSGMTLRQALDVLVALDSRYEWRDMDGVIVLRPVRAWLSSENPLFRLMPAVALHEVPASAAIAQVGSALAGAPEYNDLPDTHTFSVDLPRGSLLDLLNPISRAHGELSWIWEDIPAEERRQMPRGLRHRLTFSLGLGVGISFPVP
jgi:hypothetical protein